MIKIYTKYQLTFLVIFFIVALITSLKSYADVSKSEKSRTVIGSHNAAVKIKVFSSLTCPHCAYFHIKVVSEIKKKYIESGKVQLILIDFPLDQAAFNASKLLHCLDQKDKIKFLDTIYETQNKWTAGSNINDINENLKKIVKTLGISSTQFDKCLIDEAISDKILSELINAKKKYSIEATPTIIINEKKLEGSVSFKNIKKKIDKII